MKQKSGKIWTSVGWFANNQLNGHARQFYDSQFLYDPSIIELDNSPFYDGYFKNDLKNGEWMLFLQNGDLVIGEYVDGVLSKVIS